jgi:cyclohexyl-isocyanide hydratase
MHTLPVPAELLAKRKLSLVFTLEEEGGKQVRVPTDDEVRAATLEVNTPKGTNGAGDFVIAIPIYPGVDLMDIAAPCEIFHWMADYWKARHVQVYLVAESLAAVTTGAGVQITPHKTFGLVPQVDLLWIPGGTPDALVAQMGNTNYVRFIQARAKTAQFVASVCEGALLAANAGLLDGCEVTTHWAFIECLKEYPKVKVSKGYPRYVHSGNRVTGGGISAGLDEALYFVKIIAGENAAKEVQGTMQYFPRPPVTGSIPGSIKCPLEGKIPVTLKTE